MALFGWLFVTAMTGLFSAGWLVLAYFTLPTYTVGGRRNTWSDRIFILIGGAVLGYMWYAVVFQQAPFEIHFN